MFAAIKCVILLPMSNHKNHQPTIISRAEHTISRANINEYALKVLYRLKQGGFEAFLVGGCVRDLLVNIKPKDFDIATSAEPEQVKKLFRNCRLIGRRFRLAHVHFGREIIEVATFRAACEHHHAETGMILRDNIYGSIEEDAWRRDFTINALYYNIKDFSIIDFTSGMQDLKAKTVRMIGDPLQRYQEDPVRMLRALRTAAKLNFKLEAKTGSVIAELADLLQNVPQSRLFDETIKWFNCGHSLNAFNLLLQHGLFKRLFPLSKPGKLLEHGFANTDQRMAAQKSLNPAFLLSVLLWQPFQDALKRYKQKGLKPFPALQQAAKDVLHQQAQLFSIPKRIQLMIKEIWMLQNWLLQPTPRKVHRTLRHKRFRASYDFLLLRVQAGEKLATWADWWTELQAADGNTRAKMIKAVPRSLA